MWAQGPPHPRPRCQKGGGSSATIRLYSSEIQTGKWPNYPSTVNSPLKCRAVYYCLAAQEESLRKQHLLSTAWNLNHFLEWPGFGRNFCSLQAHNTLCAAPCPAFQCCCSEMSILCTSQNFIQKFNAVWFGGCCLGSCQTVAKRFTEVQTLFLPAL